MIFRLLILLKTEELDRAQKATAHGNALLGVESRQNLRRRTSLIQPERSYFLRTVF